MIYTARPDGRQRNRPLKDYSGQRFGRLVVRTFVERDPKWNGHKWLFRCDCGAEIVANIKTVKSGNVRSCGCLFKEMMRARNTTHGLSARPEYRLWQDMRARCNSPHNKEFRNYGARGIKVCERWTKFQNFFADMGPRPAGLTVERLDVNGDYEPSNCVWASWEAQANNKRTNMRLTIGEETKTLMQWCRHFDVSRTKVRYRLARGMAPLAALTAADLRRAN